MNTTTAVTTNPSSTAWRNRCYGVWRLTWPRFFSPRAAVTSAVLLALLAVLCAISVGRADPRQYGEWVAQFYLLVLLPVLAYLFGARAVRDDLGSVSVDYLLTRPMPRSVYLAVRYACHLACMEVVFFFGLAVLGGVGFIRDIPQLSSILFHLFLAQVLVLVAFTAFGFFAGALSRRYLVLGLAYGAIVEIGIGQIPIQLNRLSMLHHIRTILPPIAGESGLSGFEGGARLPAAGFLLAFTALFMGAAIVLFGRREFAGEVNRDV